LSVRPAALKFQRCLSSPPESALGLCHKCTVLSEAASFNMRAGKSTLGLSRPTRSRCGRRPLPGPRDLHPSHLTSHPHSAHSRPGYAPSRPQREARTCRRPGRVAIPPSLADGGGQLCGVSVRAAVTACQLSGTGCPRCLPALAAASNCQTRPDAYDELGNQAQAG